MAGIAGVADFRPGAHQDAAALEGMIRRLSHRGAERRCAWMGEDGVGLGHAGTRQSEGAAGPQPLTRSCGALTLDGSLYNVRELAEQLRGKGHQLAGGSDAEVVLAAWGEWGESCLERMNGDFALAFFDSRSKVLFLARDRLGVKPLFFSSVGGRLSFASEIKALLPKDRRGCRVGAEGLAELVLNSPFRTPGAAVFEGIEELPPGSWLAAGRRGIRSRPYWRLPDEPNEDGEAVAVRRLRDLLEDAVTQRAMAGTPICALLSGGMDSSAVCALAVAALRASGKGPLCTFTLDYEENERHFVAGGLHPTSDGHFAEEVARTLGARHRRVSVSTRQILAEAATALAARDLPTSGDHDVALYLLCRSVGRHAAVALSGDGADEVLAGSYGAPEERDRLPAAAWFPGLLPAALWQSLLRPEMAERILPERDEGPREIERARLLHWFLERADRMSGATGVEVRMPFCDHRLVEYVWNLPGAVQATGGIQKGLLRRALADVLPASVIERSPSCFPASHDPLLDNTLRVLLKQSLASPESRLLELFRRGALEEVLSIPSRPGLIGSRSLLWFLVQLDAWMQRYQVAIV